MNRTTLTKRTTIYDLAQLAGTSASAVSAVLNGNWKKRRISAKLAEKITKLAEEQGYALNMQASVLRRERSKIIGMLVPKYDNRYFGSIVEQFENLARERGLFPIITCTRRDPALEVEAARAILLRSNEINQMMKVIGEEGTSDEDYILYQKGELLDAVYLQQNSFDPIDAACSPERQLHEFNILYDVLTRTLVALTEGAEDLERFRRNPDALLALLP